MRHPWVCDRKVTWGGRQWILRESEGSEDSSIDTMGTLRTVRGCAESQPQHGSLAPERGFEPA